MAGPIIPPSRGGLRGEDVPPAGSPAAGEGCPKGRSPFGWNPNLSRMMIGQKRCNLLELQRQGYQVKVKADPCPYRGWNPHIILMEDQSDRERGMPHAAEVLEIQGFKSFPDRTQLTFGPGDPPVVGPSSSRRKSNISDAVRWVLGNSPAAPCRAPKMEDVIFGGTQTHAPRGYAFVSLTIDNRDRALPMEEDGGPAVSPGSTARGGRYHRVAALRSGCGTSTSCFLDHRPGAGRLTRSSARGRSPEIRLRQDSDRQGIFEEAAGIAKFQFRRTEAEPRPSRRPGEPGPAAGHFGELEDRWNPAAGEAEKARNSSRFSRGRKDAGNLPVDG